MISKHEYILRVCINPVGVAQIFSRKLCVTDSPLTNHHPPASIPLVYIEDIAMNRKTVIGLSVVLVLGVISAFSSKIVLSILLLAMVMGLMFLLIMVALFFATGGSSKSIRIMSAEQEKRLDKLVELGDLQGTNGVTLLYEALENLNRYIPRRAPTLEEVIHYITDYKSRTRDLRGVPTTDKRYGEYIRVHYMH